MTPDSAARRRFHRPARSRGEEKQATVIRASEEGFRLLRTEDAVGPSQDRTGPTEPFTSGNIADTVAMLMHTNMASFAEDHCIVVVRIGQETDVADSGVVVVARLLLQ